MKVAFVAVIVVSIFAIFSEATTCVKPTATSSSYTTDDAFFHYRSAFVLEFVLKCQNDAKDLPLYAEVNGRFIQVAASLETNRYQVSWTEEHEKSPGGVYQVNIHDEDGYAAIRKLQRNNEDIKSVKPLVSFPISHGGPQKGPRIQTSIVAIALFAILWYFAYSTRSTLEA